MYVAAAAGEAARYSEGARVHYEHGARIVAVEDSRPSAIERRIQHLSCGTRAVRNPRTSEAVVHVVPPEMHLLAIARPEREEQAAEGPSALLPREENTLQTAAQPIQTGYKGRAH